MNFAQLFFSILAFGVLTLGIFWAFQEAAYRAQVLGDSITPPFLRGISAMIAAVYAASAVVSSLYWARMTDEIECLIGIVLLFVMYVAWIFESDD